MMNLHPKQNRWQDQAMLVLAAWLALSPFVLGYATSTPALLASIAGALILLVSVAAAFFRPHQAEHWVDAAVGLALMSSPSIMGFGNQATPAGNVFLVGMLVLVIGGAASFQDLGEPSTRRPG